MVVHLVSPLLENLFRVVCSSFTPVLHLGGLISQRSNLVINIPESVKIIPRVVWNLFQKLVILRELYAVEQVHLGPFGLLQNADDLLDVLTHLGGEGGG